MDRHAVSPFRPFPNLLVPYSLSRSLVIKQLMQMVTMVPGQGGRFQCASPNKMACSLGFYVNGVSFLVVLSQSF